MRIQAGTVAKVNARPYSIGSTVPAASASGMAVSTVSAAALPNRARVRAATTASSCPAKIG